MITAVWLGQEWGSTKLRGEVLDYLGQLVLQVLAVFWDLFVLSYIFWIIFPREQLTQLESGSTPWSNPRSPLESWLREGTRWDLYSSIYWQGERGWTLSSCLSWQGGARFPDPLALGGLEASRSKWASEPGKTRWHKVLWLKSVTSWQRDNVGDCCRPQQGDKVVQGGGL